MLEKNNKIYKKWFILILVIFPLLIAIGLYFCKLQEKIVEIVGVYYTILGTMITLYTLQQVESVRSVILKNKKIKELEKLKKLCMENQGEIQNLIGNNEYQRGFSISASIAKLENLLIELGSFSNYGEKFKLKEALNFKEKFRNLKSELEIDSCNVSKEEKNQLKESYDNIIVEIDKITKYLNEEISI